MLVVNYSKTCLNLPLKNRQNKDLNYKWWLNEGRKYCRMLPFDLHLGIIGLENQFLVFLSVAVLDRFYCTFLLLVQIIKNDTIWNGLKPLI